MNLLAMPPHQQRVIEEKQELAVKVSKLKDFINGNAIFDSLPVAEQDLLKEQLTVMERYSEILSKRIACF